MNTKQILRILLLIEAILVLVGCLFHFDVWVAIVCYWAVAVMLHLNDVLEKR